MYQLFQNKGGPTTGATHIIKVYCYFLRTYDEYVLYVKYVGVIICMTLLF